MDDCIKFLSNMISKLVEKIHFIYRNVSAVLAIDHRVIISSNFNHQQHIRIYSKYNVCV